MGSPKKLDFSGARGEALDHPVNFVGFMAGGTNLKRDLGSVWRILGHFGAFWGISTRLGHDDVAIQAPVEALGVSLHPDL